MDNISILKQLGLDDAEVSIYLELLKHGGLQASKVAKAVGIKRTTVYPILQKLAQGGFVTVYYRKGQRFYYAQKPRSVAALFGKKLDLFYGIVPLLESIEKKQITSAGLRYIETVDELKQFYIGILDEYRDREYGIIGSASGWEDLDAEFFAQYRRDRAKNNIRTRLLLTADSQEMKIPEEFLLRTCKYLPSRYSFKSTLDVYDDKVLVISPELQSLAIVISVPAMMDLFHAVFALLWDIIDNRPKEG